jgi:hypothetical protein
MFLEGYNGGPGASYQLQLQSSSFLLVPLYIWSVSVALGANRMEIEFHMLDVEENVSRSGVVVGRGA